MSKQAVLDRKKIPNVILVGSTGSGKSTVGQELASALRFGVLDIDELIEKRSGMAIAELFKKEGEDRFRQLESDIIKSIGSICNHVVITGAGALGFGENLKMLQDTGPIIWLATPTAEIVRRLDMYPDEIRKRPLLADAANIEDRAERYKFLTAKLDEMLEQRQSLFEQADYTVTCTFATPATCAQFIKATLVGKNDTESDGKTSDPRNFDRED